MEPFGAAQLALPLGGLLGQDVTPVGRMALDVAGGGALKALGGPAIGLDLGHQFYTSLLIKHGLFLLGTQHHHHLPSFHLSGCCSTMLMGARSVSIRLSNQAPAPGAHVHARESAW